MTSKSSLRTAAQAARIRRTAEERRSAREAIRQIVLQRCRERGLVAGSVVAGYVPLPTEPGSVELLEDLSALGYRVIVPITLPDRDLDWSLWSPQPTAVVPCGVSAISHADLIPVPALLVDRSGNRLGRGGGSYDRALARATGVPSVALVYGDELVPTLPADPWDVPVTIAVTPEGWTPLTPTGRSSS